MEAIEPARLSLKERQWNLREDAILDAASELMASKGYNAMTMDDIANLVGISKATLYQHFSSKHDLVICVACRTSDRCFSRMNSIDQQLSSKQRVSELIDRIVDERFGSDSPPFVEAVGELMDMLSSDHPFIQKELRNKELVMSTMELAQRDGVLVQGLSLAVVVHLILSLVNCVELERDIRRGSTTPAAVADTLKRMILKP
jgi:AcrR family transcriptional regulator